MKILIAADMEGVTGVVHWDQVNAQHSEYERFRRLMTQDVNAAVRGAYEGGASEVLVSDGHGSGRNILIEELDRRARLNSGSPSPFSMVQGIDSGIAAVMFIGYHARVGTQHAILEHTWSDTRIANLTLQGEPYGEIGLNAALCGHFNAPVILISGDQAACSEATQLIPGIKTAVVKRASGRMAAELLAPALTQEMIAEAAATAVQALKRGESPTPHRLKPPIRMEVQFVHSEMADRAALLPGSSRSGRSIAYTADDMATLYLAFKAAVNLA